MGRMMNDRHFAVSHEGFLDIVRAAMSLSKAGLAGDPIITSRFNEAVWIDMPTQNGRHPFFIVGWSKGTTRDLMKLLESSAIIVNKAERDGFQRVSLHYTVPSAHEVIAAMALVRHALSKTGASEELIERLTALRGPE